MALLLLLPFLFRLPDLALVLLIPVQQSTVLLPAFCLHLAVLICTCCPLYLDSLQNALALQPYSYFLQVTGGRAPLLHVHNSFGRCMARFEDNTQYTYIHRIVSYSTSGTKCYLAQIRVAKPVITVLCSSSVSCTH